MPFLSSAQRRFMFAKHPKIAKKWVNEGKKNYHPDVIKMAKVMAS